MKIIDNIKKKILSKWSYTLTIMIMIVVAFIVLTIFVENLNIPAVDLTKEKLYSITDESKRIIEKIDKEIMIYIFGYNESFAEVDIIKQYQAINPNIKFEITNVHERVDLAKEYDIYASEQAILLISDGNYKRITNFDLETIDYWEGQIYSIAEQKMTNAMVEITTDFKPKIYFLSGHGELTLNEDMTILESLIKNEMYEVETIDLLVTTQIPEDCDTLAICAPMEDFKKLETDLIIDYIKNGGDIVFLADVQLEEKEFPNIQNILDEYGIILTNGFTLEMDSNRIFLGLNETFLPSYGYHDIVSKTKSEAVIMFLTIGINFAEDTKLKELNVENNIMLKSSNNSWLRRDLNNYGIDKVEGDINGPITVAAISTKTIEDRKSNLVVFGSNIFITDLMVPMVNEEYPAIALYNNRNLILDTLNYLNEREDAISIRKNKTDSDFYIMTRTENILVILIILIIPVVIITIGVIVWYKRKNMK